ncbi:MAG TPA: Ig-like domain-containing protein [Arachnia sp.]|nr:Ig-like domain-containing protein [Arachnia sp.]HMT85289.1 Ig-like domain-containing protein [Arachnia sp.]
MRIRERSRRALSALAAVSVAGAGLLAGGATPAAADTQNPDDSLILHYDFEDGQVSGAQITDLSTRGLNGTIVNPSTSSIVDGRRAGTKALALPGGASSSTTAAYVSIPNGLFADASAMTISAWVKWDGGADFQWLYNLGKNNTAATFYTPSFQGDGRARSSIKPVNGSAEVGVSGTDKLPAGSWQNVTTTIDQSTITYYLNGVKVGSQPAVLDLDAVMHSPSNTVSGYLGKAFWTGHPFFDGAIDDFRVYDVALDGAQIAALASNQEATVASLVADKVAVRATVGVAPALPATVAAVYSDGVTRGATVTWEPVDPASYAVRGSFDVVGVVDGFDGTVTAHVTVGRAGEIAVDLSSDTGDFHGGASGTLYGIYGEDLPSDNLIDGINLRTVATKAQDGPQHPGADALEVVQQVADSSGGDVYIYMTDIHRGFPYQWEGSTPAQKMDIYLEKLGKQVDQVLELPAKYQDHIVFMPFNEPEGNMFGTGTWSYNGVSWLNSPTAFFDSWDRAYRLIKGKAPHIRISGPNTSLLYTQNRGFLAHTIAADTVPDVFGWHELGDPARVRTAVDRYRGWENELFAGTEYEGTHLPINVTEYAFNYHTSVPGQMIQWISAIEEKKIDADIAYWNIDGNLSDSAVQVNRGNGQWWLLNAYSQMSGHTVAVTPPSPNVSYTVQGVASLDESKKQARLIFGGSTGSLPVGFDRLPADVFGSSVHAMITEIPWTGQIGDSAQPLVVADAVVPVQNGSVEFDFGGSLPALKESSAYQIILTPGAEGTADAVATQRWFQSYEAEAAPYTGSPRYLNGPEGSPSNVAGFYTSGGRNIGGLRTDSTLALNFPVTVPEDGEYDLQLFTSTLNTFAAVAEQGPTNVFVRVDGGAEQELFLPLGYKWVVWDHADTKVDLTAGAHTITVAARSLDGTRATKGDAIIDRITLTLPEPAAAESVYEAEYATLDGASARYDRAGVSGSGVVEAAAGDTVAFWVYSAEEGESVLRFDAPQPGNATVRINGRDAGTLESLTSSTSLFLSGGVNKVEVVGGSQAAVIDRLVVGTSAGVLLSTRYQAEDATLAGSASVASLSLADGGKAVVGVGGTPGNGNTLTFEDVQAERAGVYALTIRYSNEEQSPATHYNPDPLARHAEVTVNGESMRVWFPHSFHKNNFWELSVPVTLKAGSNTISFASEELPNFDGETYASDVWPDVLLRSKFAPNLDWIAVTPMAESTTAPEQPAFSAVLTSRCVAGKSTLVATITNEHGSAIDATISSPYGTQSVASLASGTSKSFAFSTRLQAMPAGTVTVTAADGSAQRERTFDYDAHTCG